MQKNEEISLPDLIASEQFQKYCLSPDKADIAHWKQWQQNHPDDLPVFNDAKNWVLGLSIQLSDGEIEDAFQQVLNQTASTTLSQNKPRPFFRPWMGIAASILVLCASLFLWQANTTVSLQTIQTNFGETQKINLADGSQLMLNANSTVRFASSWGQDVREVWLEGEGFFEVAHDPTKPFVVHTTQGDIKVLGTSFNAYQRGEKLNVTLIEGKVNLRLPSTQEIVMKPGHQVRIEQDQITHDSIDIEPIIAWKNGHLLFRDATIRSIIERLKVEFDWKIVVTNPDILDKRIHAVIHEYDPEVLLNALAEIYDLNIEKLGKGRYQIK